MAIDATVRSRELIALPQLELHLPREERRGMPLSGEGDPAAAALRRDEVFRRALAVGDLIALLGTGALTLGLGGLHLVALALIPLMLLAAKTMGLYERDQVLLSKRTLDEAPGLFHLATLVALVYWLAHEQIASGSVTTGRALLSWMALFVALLLCRTAARRLAQAATPLERCLVVAEADGHARLAEKLEYSPRLKSRVVAHLPLLERRAASHAPPHAALERTVPALGIHRVIVAPDGVEPGVVLDVVSRAKMLGVNVSVLPRVCEVIGSSVEFDDLGGMTLLGVRPLRLSRSSQVIKRSVDDYCRAARP